MIEGKKRAPDLSSVSILADESDSEKQGLRDRLQRYAVAKRHQTSVIEYIVNHDVFDLKGIVSQKEVDALRQCSSFLYFRHYHQINEYKLIGGITCKKHMLCWPCALRRSAKYVKKNEAVISQVISENNHLVPVLLTYTVKNRPDLLDCYNHLTRNYSKLIDRRRQCLNGRNTYTVLSKVEGASGGIELKKGKNSGEWHVHLHQVALVDPSEFTWEDRYDPKAKKFITVPVELKQELSQEWHKQTSDSFMVDVRGIDHSSEESLIHGILEAFKYTLKPGDMDEKDHVEAYMSLKGRRTILSFGNLYGVKVDELTDDVEEEMKLLPYIDLVYRYSNTHESYQFKEETDLGELPEKTVKGNPDPRRKNIEKECQSRLFSPDYIKNWVNEKIFFESVNREVKGYG